MPDPRVLSSAEVAEALAIADKATPNWSIKDSFIGADLRPFLVRGTIQDGIVFGLQPVPNDDDLRFAAAARTDVPALCASHELLRAEVERLRGLLDTPQLHDFSTAVTLEAAHQRERWGSEHDAGKEPQDWFWLLGYLAGKALKAHVCGDTEKALHHTISSAAALANWHAAISGADTGMRPGIEPPAEVPR